MISARHHLIEPACHANFATKRIQTKRGSQPALPRASHSHFTFALSSYRYGLIHHFLNGLKPRTKELSKDSRHSSSIAIRYQGKGSIQLINDRRSREPRASSKGRKRSRRGGSGLPRDEGESDRRQVDRPAAASRTDKYLFL